ncbi:MAG: alpha/beta hydrolase [Pseudomonadota bacterium]|jgi:phospholipase/carboxylesterase
MNRHESTESEEALTSLKFIYRSGAHASAPLVVLVHGRAGNRSVMWTFERSIPEECHVVAFQAFLPDVLGGWSWWDMTTPGSKRDAILAAAGRFSRALKAFVDLYRLTPTKIVGMGFSQGSVLLSAVALRGFADFDGVAVLAGFVFLPGEPPSIPKKPAILVAHGVLDETIPVTQARDGVSSLKRLGFDVTYVEEEVGHKVGIEGTRAIKTWLSDIIKSPSEAL